MPRLFAPISVLSILLASFGTASGIAGESTELGKSLQSKLDAFHANEPANGEALKVVYFHPADNPPQPGYVERTARLMTDFSDFLKAEITRHGFTNNGVPFETNDDGSLKIHLVTGSSGSDAYNYNYQSGQKIRREAEKALGDAIDFSHDFVFLLCGLCQKRGENDYFFHSPYFGDGTSNQIRGLCYAADCEVLDPLNLTAEAAKVPFKYEEHSGTFRKNLARFNSWYLGGIVHELGHGLSLPHNGELPQKRDVRGRALMGGGNHTYGEDRWGGGKGTFLEFVNAVRLSAHPLFTQSDRERFTKVESNFEEIRYSGEGEALTITGKVQSTPPPLAVLAYSDPPGRDGYNAITWVAPVSEDGSFRINAQEHPFSGLHGLTITVVKMNGGVEKLQTRYRVNENHEPDIATLKARGAARPAIQAINRGDNAAAKKYLEEQISLGPPPGTLRILRHIENLLDPAPPVSPLAYDGTELALSDAVWTEASVGWGKTARNRFYHPSPSERSFLLELGGEIFEKGLYAHAPSRFVYKLEGQWNTFHATVGLQAGVGSIGRSQFTVRGDGKVLATSGILKGAETEELQVDIRGVQTLELKVESTIQGNPQCWSVWGRPLVSR